MIRPKCPLCGKDLKHPYETKEVNGEMKEVLVEEQVSYWMHNPRLIQEDILVTAHKECFDKVKKVFPDFDQPVQEENPLFPVINSDLIKKISLKEFKLLKRL